MKHISILIGLILFSSIASGQSIYKGLTYEMSPDEAKQEYKSNKDDYKSIDLGNGFVYRTYRQNFEYQNNRLVGLLLTPKGSALGQSYRSAKNHLIYTRNFFEDLGYTTFIDNKWWNAPHNYVNSGSKYGLVLRNREKDRIIQLYPVEVQNNFLVHLQIWHYDTWMGLYKRSNKQRNEKVEDSGF